MLWQQTYSALPNQIPRINIEHEGTENREINREGGMQGEDCSKQKESESEDEEPTLIDEESSVTIDDDDDRGSDPILSDQEMDSDGIAAEEVKYRTNSIDKSF